MNVHTYKKDLFDSYKKPEKKGCGKGNWIRKKVVVEGEGEDKRKPEELTKKQVYNILRAVMPEHKAKLVAGYSKGSNLSHMQAYDGTVAEIRERIQNDPELGFMRQIQFYAEMRDGEEKGDSDRIAAARQLDVIAGYNAPAKVEVHERKTLIAAMQVLHRVRAETGLSPVELKKALEGKVEIEEVPAIEENVLRETSEVPMEVVNELQ